MYTIGLLASQSSLSQLRAAELCKTLSQLVIHLSGLVDSLKVLSVNN